MSKKTSDITKYEHPAVAVDMLIMTVRDNDLQIALVQRAIEPFEGLWAIPGGFVRMEESLESAAQRELFEETSIKGIYLEQLYTFGDPGRDPRTRVVSVSYMGLVHNPPLGLKASTDAQNAKWFSVNKLPKLAFDHKKIIEYAVSRLGSKIEYSNIAYSLLPKKFRLSDLQKVYEAILGHSLDKRNFRKKMLSLGLLESTGEKALEGAHRPAMLYQFKTQNVVFFG